MLHIRHCRSIAWRYLDMINHHIHPNPSLTVKTERTFSKERSVFVMWKITPLNNLRTGFGSTARMSHADGVSGNNSPPMNKLLAWLYLPPCATVKDFMRTHGRHTSSHYYETREENDSEVQFSSSITASSSSWHIPFFSVKFTSARMKMRKKGIFCQIHSD